MHLVHYKDGFADASAAVESKEVSALAVVGYLFEVGIYLRIFFTKNKLN